MTEQQRGDATPRHRHSSSPMLDRRAALKLFASGAALALASCGRPAEEVVPYVEMPERLVPGVPLRFATALPLAGYGRGVIVTSIEGRPIKIDGNPRHPASLGSTDVFAEASVLSLYDPDRSKAPRRGAEIPDWSAFEAALLARLEEERARQGAGLAIFTARVTSPPSPARSAHCKSLCRKRNGIAPIRLRTTRRATALRWRSAATSPRCRALRMRGLR